MMNPSVYLREAERIEKAHAAIVASEKTICKTGNLRLAYSRERLPSGCILLKMSGAPRLDSSLPGFAIRKSRISIPADSES